MLLIRQLIERDPARAEKIDRVSRWSFPLLYVATHAALVLFNALGNRQPAKRSGASVTR